MREWGEEEGERSHATTRGLLVRGAVRPLGRKGGCGMKGKAWVEA